MPAANANDRILSAAIQLEETTMKTKYNSTRSTVEANGGDQTQNNIIRRKWSALALPQGLAGCLVFVSVLALLPSSVEAAECREGWDLGSTWTWKLKQSNQAEPNAMKLTVHSRNLLYGMASYGTGAKKVDGKVTGSIHSASIHLEIFWSNGLIGIYDGQITPWKDGGFGTYGRIKGTAYEKKTPGFKVSWSADEMIRCLPPPQEKWTPPPTRN
jgi:hypothetical protein